VIHHNGGNLSIDQIWNVWQDREADVAAPPILAA